MLNFLIKNLLLEKKVFPPKYYGYSTKILHQVVFNITDLNTIMML